ncbi:penicillin-binding protein 1A [Oceanibacterium hippocampi]|uniref:Penicillin-binding protein 1A n=1 Tax=Oceanibacterium hippocampi TaxID=745714 RepID=A0A1Y5SXZ1_9PROT|nr:penicillin-binding protein 1A [Oceanibacterium hippocampi]SLN49051.1 Penicillin-binding protein 1A [Oceanibacterium hippocampi]
MKRLLKVFIVLLVLGLLGGIAGAGAVLYAFWHYGKGLPDYQQLAGYEPPVVTRVHAGDGSLLTEYARERRLFVPIEVIPKHVWQAFLSAEDQRFFSHPGVDFIGVARAVLVNLRQIGTDRRPVGASTITQQVAKNMLLTNEVSIERKVKEMILAFRIERTMPKERILELYLNEIYLGQGSYGVAAAALTYFDKALGELTIPEAAYLAALPKAPNNYHPVRKRDAAIARRNWIIGRMVEDGYVPADQMVALEATPLGVVPGREATFVKADWFVEEVRRELYDLYGADGLYDGGLSVRTTMETELQLLGQRVLRDGLRAYDRRHGWRGPLDRLPLDGDWQARFAEWPVPSGLTSWWPAVVTGLDAREAMIAFQDGSTGTIPLDALKWARKFISVDGRGPAVKSPADVLDKGDIVAVSPLAEEGGAGNRYALEQIPKINGALVAMDPHTGRVLALVGGWSHAVSEFNRATQAARQPGSAFKPFVYAAAMENGFTPSSLVLDAPFVLDQGELGKWKPGNYSNKFYGPSTLRLGLEKSRNLMTVRLARSLGIDVVADYAKRFGIAEDMPQILSMSLGAMQTTLLQLTTAYAILDNGGKSLTPTLIDRVQDRRGRTIFRHDKRDCDGCLAASWHGQPVPKLPDNRSRVMSAEGAYQVVSMLEGVVERGTGRSIASLGRPLAGKTGTTNDSFDAWFVGFAPDLAVGVYTGFDQPSTLGDKEQGASVAAPIFKAFMAEALAGQPAIPFRVPPGIRLVRVRADSGVAAQPGDRNVILEAFRPGTEPTAAAAVLDGSDIGAAGGAASAGGSLSSGTGGLY